MYRGRFYAIIVPMKKDRTNLAILAAVAVYTLWGFTFIASKTAQNFVSPFALLAYRFDIATLLLALPLVFGLRHISLKGKKIGHILLLGSLEPCLYFLGEQFGIKYTNSAFSGVMIAIIPIVTLILASFLLGEHPSKAQWLFSFLSIAGIIVITICENKGGDVTLKGFLFLTVAVLTGSLYTIVSRKISDEFGVYERTFIMQCMGAVFYTLLTLLECRGNLSGVVAPLADRGFILSILYLSVFGSVLGYTLFNFAVTNAPTAKVVILCNLTTVLSVLGGVFILGESFSPVSAVAMIAVIIGIIGVQKN